MSVRRQRAFVVLVAVLGGACSSRHCVTQDHRLRSAEDAFFEGQFRRAIELAGAAKEVAPAKAARILAASYCALNDRRHASQQLLAGAELAFAACAGPVVTPISDARAVVAATTGAVASRAAPPAPRAFSSPSAPSVAPADASAAPSELAPSRLARGERLARAAQDEYVNGRYEKAIALSNELAKIEPLKAYRIIGAASCFLHDRKGARQAAAQLGPPERSFLTYVCSRNNIRLGSLE